MVEFVYVGRDMQGTRVEGVLAAKDEPTARARLRERGVIVTQLASRGTVQKAPRGGRVKQDELTVFARQLASMIDAGVSLTDALAIVAEESKNPAFTTAIEQVRSDIHQGASLEQAIARHPRVFPRVFRQLIKVAEAGSALDDILDMLATHLEREQDLREQVRSAFMYPIAVGGVATVTVAILLIFVVPVFKNVFQRLGLTLPLSTKALIALGTAMRHYWWAFLIGGPALIVGLAHIRSTSWGRDLWDRAILKLPLLGKLSRKAAITRWVRACHILVGSGVPVATAFATSADAADNVVIADAIRRVCASLEKGRDIAAPLRASGQFPSMVVEMVRAGEESGSLDLMLEKCAAYCER
ncbi:MAG: type II secretion system F family protein, partial [Armatimonadota bacterium]